MKAMLLAVCLSLSLFAGFAYGQRFIFIDPENGSYVIDNHAPGSSTTSTSQSPYSSRSFSGYSEDNSPYLTDPYSKSNPPPIYAQPNPTRGTSEMTGADFLANLLIFGVVVILPALIISILRAGNACDGDQEGGWIAGFFAFIISLLGIYIILVFINWDSELSIDYLLVYPIAEALGVAFHVLLILLFSKIISIWLKPESDSICLGYYGLLFGLSAFVVHDILKGKDSYIINWLN